MKKVLIGVMVLTVFFMSGCESFGEEVVEHLPVLELNGDIDVTIGLNEEYEDPGVELLGDFDLEISTHSNLDITNYGIYYIDYDIEFEGKHISVGRKIRVVPQTEINFDLALSVISNNPFSLTFSIEIDDEDGNLKDGKAVLYLLDEKIGEQLLSSGTNLLTFDELSSYTYYRLELEGSYTDNDVEFDLLSYSIGAKTTMVSAEDNPRLELIGDAEISLNVGDAYVEQGVNIIGDYDLEVSTLSNVNTNEPGVYYVVYTVEFNEATFYAHRTVIVDGEALYNYDITIELIEKSINSIKVSVTLVDDRNIITVPKGVLYSGTDVVGEFTYSVGTTVMEFTGLFPLTTYNFVVKGAYIQNGTFVSIEEQELEITTLELNVITPFLMLNGDSIIEIDVNSVFADPGAYLLGIEDAVITTESNLDVTVPGTYTITYSTTHNGTDLSITRSIIVLEPVLVDFGVSLTLDSTTETSITYSVTLNDQYSLLTTHAARLFKDAVFIEEISFIEGTNTIEFTNLLPSTEYNVELIGEYMQNGILISMGDYQLTATTVAASLPVISLTSSEIGYIYLDVVINVVDEYSQISEMTAIVYDGDYQEMIYTLVVGENIISFDFLGHSTDYVLTVEYTYTLYGEITVVEESIDLLSFMTNIPPKPVMNSVDCVSTDTTLTCTFDWDTSGFDSDIIFFAQLWFNGSYSEVEHFTNNGTDLFFENLDPETDYTLKVFSNYTVSSTDQFFASYLFSIDAKTEEEVIKTEPVVENIVYTYTPTSITIDFDVVDTSGAFESGYIKLLKGWTNIESIDCVVGHNTITFDTNITGNEAYKAEFRISYDIGEGYVHNNVLMVLGTLDTPPEITLDSFAGKQMYFSLDQIILQIDLANSDEYEIEFVTIDGTRYETYKYPSNPSVIYIDMGVESSGTYFYTLDNIGVIVNGEEYIYLFDNELTMQVYVPGSIDPSDASVTVLDITTSAVGGEVFYSVSGDTNYEDADIDVYIHLDNDYDLTVTSIRIAGREEAITDFEIISPTLIKASINIGEGTNTLSIYYIEYTRNSETIKDTLEVYYFGVVYGYLESEVTDIYDLADLQTMDETGHYRLMNDIDMGGATWIPLGTYDDAFNGSFDGNGYTISNFNITKHILEGDSYTYVGFFGYSRAFIGDLTISDATISITTDDETNHVYVGMVSGYQSGSSLVNVHVTGDSSISVDGLYRGSVGGLIGHYSEGWKTVIKDTSTFITITFDGFPLDDSNYSLTVGGLIGSNSSGNILHSYSYGSITITNTLWQKVYAGGLVGYIYGYYDNGDRGTYILNSYSDMDIISSGGITGGLLGGGHSVDSRTILINTFATGDVFGRFGYTGGLVGANYGEIYNSFSTGDVNATYGSVGAIYANDSFSYNYNSNMNNVYNWEDQSLTKEFVQVNGSDTYIVQILDAPTTEFNSEEFYTDIVGLNPYFFDFSNLDILLDHLPTF